MRATIAALVIASASAAGCCQTAGRATGQGVTNFTSGVGSGVDEGLLVELKFTEQAARMGLGSTTAKWASGKRVQAYVTAKAPYTGKLMAKALNKEGNEIGRSVIDVAFGADDAKYVVFPFPPEMDSKLVAQYWVDVVK